MVELLLRHNDTRSLFACEQSVEVAASLVFEVLFKNENVFGVNGATG